MFCLAFLIGSVPQSGGMQDRSKTRWCISWFSARPVPRKIGNHSIREGIERQYIIREINPEQYLKLQEGGQQHSYRRSFRSKYRLVSAENLLT
jgi:hypothetical protein